MPIEFHKILSIDIDKLILKEIGKTQNENLPLENNYLDFNFLRALNL